MSTRATEDGCSTTDGMIEAGALADKQTGYLSVLARASAGT